MRAKLQRLAEKYSVVSANNVNAINKRRNYGKLVRYSPRSSTDLYAKSSTTRNRNRVDYFESKSNAEEVSDDRNGKETTVTSPESTTYSETVHDQRSLSDGQAPISEITTKQSTIRTKWQHESPKNEAGNKSDSLAGVSSTKTDIIVNELATFSRTEPAETAKNDAATIRKPGKTEENRKVNQPNVYSDAAKEGGGRRISQNERYSKVGRDPPFWVPMEPIHGEPFLREPVHKDADLEEPYEPIPPLAETDIGNDGTYRNRKSTSKTELDAKLLVSTTAASVRRRPEAKEGGGASELGKIASPLERKWIRQAEVAAAVVDSSRNVTDPTSGLYHNNNGTTVPGRKSPAVPVESTTENETEKKLRVEGRQELQPNDKKPAVNHGGGKDCAKAPWKNFQLIRDASSGGYYAVPVSSQVECSDQEEATPDVERKQVDADKSTVTRKTEKQDAVMITGKPADSPQPNSKQTHRNTLPEETGKAGWTLFGQTGNMSTYPSGSSPDNLPALKNQQRDSEIRADSIISQEIPVEGDLSPVQHFDEEPAQYYIIGQVRTEKDLAGKDDIVDLRTIYDDHSSGLFSNSEQEAENPLFKLPSGRQPSTGRVLWRPFAPAAPAGNPRNPGNPGDDVTEGDFRPVDQSEVNGRVDAESSTRANDRRSTEVDTQHCKIQKVFYYSLLFFITPKGSTKITAVRNKDTIYTIPYCLNSFQQSIFSMIY